MHAYQSAFLELALQAQAISFGEFTLKSGRRSPYFFNASAFNTGMAMHKIGQFYAQALISSGIDCDLLFGPAYKGIPLATATAMALATDHNRDVRWCCNRKEAKQYGETGCTVGAPLTGKVVIIDDVMTAGTAVSEAMAILTPSAAIPVGVVVALDRQEEASGTDSGNSQRSAIQQVAHDFGLPVISIVTLEHVLEYVAEHHNLKQYAPAIAAYRKRYGIG